MNEIQPKNNNGKRNSFLAHPFDALHDDMNRLFDRYVPNRLSNWFSDDEDMTSFATMDIAESDDAFDIKLDVPGVDEDDIDIKLYDNILTIKGKREADAEEKKENYYRVERSYGSFVRRVEMPADINDSKIDASIEKGVLNIHIPKSEKAKSKEKKIKIKAS